MPANQTACHCSNNIWRLASLACVLEHASLQESCTVRHINEVIKDMQLLYLLAITKRLPQPAGVLHMKAVHHYLRLGGT